MSYQILPNLIFIFSVFGIILLILRRLPEAANLPQAEAQETPIEQKLLIKGLPAVAISKTKVFVKFWAKKTWHFVLEAKDLRPTSLTGYKIKKIFGHRPPIQTPLSTQEVKNEQYFLDAIKLQPKNLDNYDFLGKFYLDTGNFSDAKDIYIYLTNHQRTSSDYQARLGHSLYKLREFAAAAEHYEQSVKLDSTQPNRYYNLGLAWEAAGNFQQAAKAFAQASTLEPGNNRYQTSLNNVLQKIDQQDRGLAVSNQPASEAELKIKIK